MMLFLLFAASPPSFGLVGPGRSFPVRVATPPSLFGFRVAPRSAACSQAEASKVIELAKKKIASDATVKEELGKLQRVTQVLGYGAPSPGSVAVSFTAAFRRQGKPFWTIAGEQKMNNRGENFGSVKAKADGAKLTSLVIQKDQGWGRSITVKV